MKRVKRMTALLMALLLLALPLTARAEGLITSKEQLNQPGMQVCVGMGSAAENIVREELPNAQLCYYTENTAAFEALAQGKVDACIYDRRTMQSALESGRTGVHLLDENMDQGARVAVGISPVSKIPDLKEKVNSFIAELREDGTLDDMYRRWITEGDDEMPDIPVPEHPEYHLIVGTTGVVTPYTYYAGTELWGYDIELARRFALWLNADLEFKVFDFGSIVAEAVTGNIDCIMSHLNVTPEREESLPFSDTLFTEPIGIMVRGDADAARTGGAAPELKSFSDFKGKTVSMLTGAPFEDLVRSKAPDIGECTFFNNTADILLALKSGKTDALLTNNAIAQLAVNRNPELTLFPENLKDGVFGLAFAKGDPRRDEWQAAFERLPEEEIQAAWAKWTGGDEAAKVLPEQDWPGTNGTVTVAACDTLEPMSYVGEGGELKGFDNEIILLMAKELDVHVEFTGMEFAAILSSVQAGKADLGCGSIIVTDERKGAVDFVEYFPAAFVLVVRAQQSETAAPGFLKGIRDSFEKTFVREKRWQLFVEGVATTVVITLLSILLGTALGFGVYLACRTGNRLVNLLTRCCVWLVKGMPMVVLLMVLYYIVFGSLSVSGVLVAVLGFTLTFGAAVFGLMKLGVGAVDPGQYEAASALGYSDAQTFFKIILPQALPHILDAYRSETVSLIKATAIVGYIAVQDLTKMGDIVRSRTYEAFFPLIAVTVIYFLLEDLLGLFFKRITRRLNPRRRSREEILKGVQTDD